MGISVFLKRYVDNYIFQTVNFFNAETGQNTNAHCSDKQRFVSLVEKTFQKRRSSFHDNRPPIVKILDSRNCSVTIPSIPLSPQKR